MGGMRAWPSEFLWARSRTFFLNVGVDILTQMPSGGLVLSKPFVAKPSRMLSWLYIVFGDAPIAVGGRGDDLIARDVLRLVVQCGRDGRPDACRELCRNA